MIPRYARRLGLIQVGSGTLETWIVIQTDEVSPHEVIAMGFEAINPELSDEEVKGKYGVSVIHPVWNKKTTDVVQ